MISGYESNRWTPTDVMKLRDFIAKGLSARIIATRLGRTTAAIRTKAQKLQIPFKDTVFDPDCNTPP